MIDKEIAEEVINGESSLRKAAEVTGEDREKIKKEIEENYQTEREKFLAQLKKNKSSANRELSEKVGDITIKEIAISIITGKISAKEASEKYKIHKQTLKRKIQELARTDKTFLKYYIDYTYGKKRDYSGINFKLLFLEMVEQDLSQTDIAQQYGIPVRTMSRELEKINKSDNPQDKELYEILKEYSYRKMQHKKLSPLEQKLFNAYIDNYRENNELVQINEMTEKEKLEEFCRKVAELENSGKTKAQIADEMGVGISTISRKKLKLNQIIEEEKLLEEDGGKD